MTQKLPLTASLAVLLIAGTAWAQPVAMPAPVVPPGVAYTIVGQNLPPMGPWIQPPSPAPGTAADSTVTELMRLYRMLYLKGQHAEAARVARQVEALNPIVGRTALALLPQDKGPCAGSCCTKGTCCATCCPQGACCATAKACNCTKGEQCCCRKACKCKQAPHADADGATSCRVFTIALGPVMPGVPCPMPVPVVGPTTARWVVGSSSGQCLPYPRPVCGLAGCAGAMQPCCTGAMPLCASCCQKPKPVTSAAVQITATGGRVHLTSPAVEVECDRVTTSDAQGRVQLEGNVRVLFRGNRAATLGADRLSLNLGDGSYEITQAAAPGSWKPTAARSSVIQPACYQSAVPFAGPCGGDDAK